MSEEKRRSGDFVERLSIMLVIGAFIGGFIVLLDIRLTLTLWGQVLQIGKEGFSPDVKGVVLQSMLITGFAAVVGFWLGTTKQGQEQAQSVSKMAEAAAPATALAVAAATGGPPVTPKNGEPVPVEIVGDAGITKPLKVEQSKRRKR